MKADQSPLAAGAVEQVLRKSLGEEAAGLELRETHVSQVFLTRSFAFKRKKPLVFDFLDYSTVARREAACRDELRLNRWLAVDVYLDVVPITAAPQGEPALGGDGEPVEWLVRMRRLPDEATLEAHLRRATLPSGAIEAIVARLVAFYRSAARPAITAAEYLTAYRGRIAANRKELADPAHGLPAEQIARLHDAQSRWLLLNEPLIAERVAARRVVDGHGDLRPEHVYLLPEPTIIDCIEFSAEFRRIDPADELAFLAMECRRLDAPQVAERILELYRTDTNDDLPPELVAFHESYRACVRAKVAALRAVQTSGDEQAAQRGRADEYLRLATEALPRLNSGLLVVVWGLSGSGKSTLARELAARLHTEHLRTDVLRDELFARSGEEAAADEGRYSQEARRQVYDLLHDRAGEVIAAGGAAVLDGTYLNARQRAAVIEAAGDVRTAVIYCDCPPEVARARIAERRARGGDASEAREEILERQLAGFTPPTDGDTTWVIDATRPVEENVHEIVTRLR